MSTVYLTVGIPASGKSTWTRENAADLNAVIVCRDDIRIMQGLKHGDDEKLVTQIHRNLIEGALLDGKNVIVADTNVAPKFRNDLIKFCHQHGADVELVPFWIELDEAIMRDANREASVGAQVIRRQYDQFKDQNLEPLERPVQRFEPYAHATEGRRTVPAICVDLDGTVAEHWNRSPYEYGKVGDDKPVRDVIEIVLSCRYRGINVLFVSGRDDSCYDDSHEWIKTHTGMTDFTLLMRKTGDKRPDWIIKNEIYDEHIIPNYKILMVFDDRDQVVKHLRLRGITVAQVNYGRF